MAEMKFTFKSSIAKMDKIVELLKTPMARCEIELAIHAGRRTVNAYLEKLMEESNKRIYIKSWKREVEGKKNHLRPVYAAGNKKCKAKPPALTNQEINKRKYARTKSDPIAYSKMLQKERHRMRMKNFVPHADVTQFWLMPKHDERGQHECN